MPKFDIGKLAAGGALAAIVMNICDYVSNNFILASSLGSAWRGCAATWTR